MISAVRTWPLWQRVAGSLAVIVFSLGLLFADFPWGMLAPAMAGLGGRALGREIVIERAHRADHISFWPTVILEGVSIAQPNGYAGPPMARIARAEIRFAALPLLIGRFATKAIDLRGATFNLRRRADGKSNWEDKPATDHGRKKHVPLPALHIEDSRLFLNDQCRHIDLEAGLVVGPAGFRISGRGTHRGQPLRLDLSGPGIEPDRTTAPYTMNVAIVSSLAGLKGTVRMDRALDIAHFDADVTARAQDLRYLDDIIQAGLFPSKPLTLAAHIRHDDRAWTIRTLNADIGRSRLRVTGKVDKLGGRTVLRGRVDAATLDFDDFSSAEQRARAAVRRAATGPRVIPATRIDLTKLGKLDGQIILNARRLLAAGPSAFETLSTTVTLDHRRLEAFPLTAGLRSGRLTGRAVVDHRVGAPKLSLDLRIQDAKIEILLFPGDAIEGPVTARIILEGSGETVREALAVSGGKVGLVMPRGTVRRDYAIFAGGDVFKAIGAIAGSNNGERTPLTCLVGSFRAVRGRLTPSPFLVDTPLSRANATGAILLTNETLDLSLAGLSKQPGPLQSTTPVRLFGTLSDPKLDIRPPRAASAHKTGLLPRLGTLIKGLKTRDEVVSAAPVKAVNCAALSATALR